MFQTLSSIKFSEPRENYIFSYLSFSLVLLCVSVKEHLKHLFVQQAPRSSATMRPFVEIKARAWIRACTFLSKAPWVLVMSRCFALATGLSVQQEQDTA